MKFTWEQLHTDKQTLHSEFQKKRVKDETKEEPYKPSNKTGWGYDIYNVSLFYVQETISDQSLVNFPLFTKFIKMIQKTNINSGNIYKTHQF